MPKNDALLKKIQEICLALPDTKLTWTWGKPHFRVGEKIFCGCGDEKGRNVVGFKLEMDHAAAVVKQSRFWRAPYVGHKGWVSMDADEIKDWDEVRAMILESYRLIAPKRTLAKLVDGQAPERKATRKSTSARASAKSATGSQKASPRKASKKPATRKASKKPATRKASKKPATRRGKKATARRS